MPKAWYDGNIGRKDNAQQSFCYIPNKLTSVSASNRVKVKGRTGSTWNESICEQKKPLPSVVVPDSNIMLADYQCPIEQCDMKPDF